MPILWKKAYSGTSEYNIGQTEKIFIFYLITIIFFSYFRSFFHNSVLNRKAFLFLLTHILVA